MINAALEALDLTAAHTILALLGTLLAVFVMQQTRYEAEDADDPAPMRFARRLSLALLALALLWSLSYSETKSWQPWPAQVLTIFAVDAVLAIRAIAIRARIRRVGAKPQSQHASDAKLTGAP